MSTVTNIQHDVVVVGARAAGSATALLLARLGHDVAVLDRTSFPSDTLSTHSISRSGVVQLARWGLLEQVLASGAPAIRQVTFHIDGEADTRHVKDKSGVDLLVAPRRHVLDPIVAGAAEAAGATMRFGITVTGVLRDADGRATGVTARDRDGAPVDVRARFVVGADGLRSRVAAAVGAPVIEGAPSGSATHYAYYDGIPWRGNEFFLAEGSFSGIFPTHGGEACIWVCMRADEAEAARRRATSVGEAWERMLVTAAPALAGRLDRGARRTSAIRSAFRLPNQLRDPAGPGWALVGDAGYHRDPITGHGLSDAFRDAEVLATALDDALRGEEELIALGRYRDERDRAVRSIFDITRRLSDYPPLADFVSCFRDLSRAIDVEAAELAARRVPGRTTLAVA